jgi:hypothetical protein
MAMSETLRPTRSQHLTSDDGSAAYSRAVRSEKCKCGHERAAHEHYRSGAECALCPSGACSRYNGPRPPWWRSVIPESLRRKRPASDAPGSKRPDDERWDDTAGNSAGIALGTGHWAFPQAAPGVLADPAGLHRHGRLGLRSV